MKSHFQQNIQYIVVLFLIFIICGYLFLSKTDTHPHGIFLPKYELDLPKISQDDVNAIEIDEYTDNLTQKDIKKSVGFINVLNHVSDKSEFKYRCKQSIQKAKYLAANAGANTIKYACLYPEGSLGSLSDVSLQAYAFRD